MYACTVLLKGYLDVRHTDGGEQDLLADVGFTHGHLLLVREELVVTEHVLGQVDHGGVAGLPRGG